MHSACPTHWATVLTMFLRLRVLFPQPNSKAYREKVNLFCCCLVAKLYLFCDSTHYSSPGSSVHGISQARILEWVAISFSGGARDQTHISCLASWLFTTEPPGKPLSHLVHFVWHTLGPSITLQMTQFHSFLWLCNILSYVCTTSSLSIHLSMDI